MLSLRYEATIVTGLGKAACGALATLKIRILHNFDIHYSSIKMHGATVIIKKSSVYDCTVEDA